MVREEKCKSLLVRGGAGAREKVTELQYNMVKVTAHKGLLRVTAFIPMKSRRFF